jgi:hypothetical protein
VLTVRALQLTAFAAVAPILVIAHALTSSIVGVTTNDEPRFNV